MLTKARTRARGFLAELGARLLRADQHRRRAVDDARRIAGVVDVVDALDLRMRLDRHRVEAALLAHHDERRLERGERLHVGLRPHVLVAFEQRQAVDVAHRHDRILEPPLRPRLGGAALRLDRVGVDVVAREAVFGGDEVGRYALRHEIGGDRDRRIDRPGAARGADADAAHQFDAAADRQLVLARHHLRRGEIDRVEAGSAEAVDLHAGHVVAEARRQRAHAGDVAARFADRIDAAHHHVVDLAGLDLVAVLDRLQRGRRQLQRRRGMQRAVRLAAPARGAHVVVDERVGHVRLSFARWGGARSGSWSGCWRFAEIGRVSQMRIAHRQIGDVVEPGQLAFRR